jgi:hypothetical protein
MLNVAGANTCGQNLTPNIIRGKAVHNAPIPAYTAAFTAVNVNSSDKDLDRLKDDRHEGAIMRILMFSF